MFSLAFYVLHLDLWSRTHVSQTLPIQNNSDFKALEVGCARQQGAI